MALRDEELVKFRFCEVLFFIHVEKCSVAEVTENKEETPPRGGVEVGDSRAQVGVGTSDCPLEAPPMEIMLKGQGTGGGGLPHMVVHKWPKFDRGTEHE